jgi:CheY-like chemotaxis protein
LRVSDTGEGIEPDVLPRIFDPFFTTKSSGHGLGLSAVLGIVRSLGGAIEVQSQPGEGTNMTVHLPCDEEARQSAREQEHASSVPVAGGTVLVVDDNEAVRTMAAMVLREGGFEVLEASNGDDALAIANSPEHAIDALLLDLSMPRRDGYSTLRELRRTHPTLPVFLSSGRPVEPPEGIRDDEYLQAIHKPYLPDDLIRMIADAVRSDEDAC